MNAITQAIVNQSTLEVTLIKITNATKEQEILHHFLASLLTPTVLSS